MSKKAFSTLAGLMVSLGAACLGAPVSTQAPTQPTAPTAPPSTPSPAPALPPGTPFADQAAQQLLAGLATSDSVRAQRTVDEILAQGDTRFIAAFIELMRMNEIGLRVGAGYEAHIAALEALSGQSFGADWPGWVEWYGATALTPPPGFTGWKGRLLGNLDPAFADFLADDAPSRVRVEEIQWGGVFVDGIPALDNPRMIPAAEAAYLTPGEPVFGLSLNGDPRAYPLRILDWHEMANDVVGGVPVSLAYCTLCGAGVAFDGRAPDGNTYTFGSSGFLFRSNKLMYDRQTRTLWNQLTGQPVLGELAAADMELSLLPLVLTSWADWLAQHPNTVVLDPNTGHSRPYEPGAAYGHYFSSEETMFPVWRRSRLLPTKARIFALRLDSVPKAYPLDTLVADEVVNDMVGETNLVIIARRGTVDVDGISRQVEAVTYEAGGEVRAYARGVESFGPGPEPDTVLDSLGREWRVTEEALIGPGGETAPRLGGHLAYWFGWFSFFPHTLVYGQP